MDSRKSDLERRETKLEEELSHLRKQQGIMCRRLQRKNSDLNDQNLLKQNTVALNDAERQLTTLNETKTNLDSMMNNINKKLSEIDVNFVNF